MVQAHLKGQETPEHTGLFERSEGNSDTNVTDKVVWNNIVNEQLYYDLFKLPAGTIIDPLDEYFPKTPLRFYGKRFGG